MATGKCGGGVRAKGILTPPHRCDGGSGSPPDRGVSVRENGLRYCAGRHVGRRGSACSRGRGMSGWENEWLLRDGRPSGRRACPGRQCCLAEWPRPKWTVGGGCPDRSGLLRVPNQVQELGIPVEAGLAERRGGWSPGEGR
jgi:hypothetical protein